MKSPFKFLEAYTLQDRRGFFGRDQEIAALYRMVFQTPLLLVYGASGSGKTSLIQCGLASRFDGADWLPLFIRRQTNVIDSLRKGLEEALPQPPDSELGFPELVSEVFAHSLRPVYLIFDQFEELFTLGSPEEQAACAEVIQSLVSRELSCKIILVIREDYLGHLYEFEKRVPTIYDFRMRVELMNATRIRSVIASSFAAFNIHTEAAEPDLIQCIIENLSDGKSRIQLPYLQVYLDTLYREDYRRTYGDAPSPEEGWPELEFTVEEVANFGTISDVLERFLLDQARAMEQHLSKHYPGMPEDTVGQVLDVFVTDEGTKRPLLYQRDPAAADRMLIPEAVHQELSDSISADLFTAVVEGLEKRRLLRVSDQMIELAHDSLAAIVYNNRSDEQKRIGELRRRLYDRYAEHRETGAYLTRKQLSAYEAWLPKLQLPPEIENFVAESEEQVRLAEEHELRLERQKVAAERQANRRLRLITWIIGAALLVAIALGVIIQHQRTQAEEMARRALSDKVGFQAAAAGDRTTGYQLARVAHTIDPSNVWATRQLLYRVYSDQNPVGRSMVFDAPVVASRFVRGGARCLVATADGTVRLITTADQTELFSWRDSTLRSIRTLAVDAGGQYLAIGDETGRVLQGEWSDEGIEIFARHRLRDLVRRLSFAVDTALLLVATVDDGLFLLPARGSSSPASFYTGRAAVLHPRGKSAALANRSGLRLRGLTSDMFQLLDTEPTQLTTLLTYDQTGRFLAAADAAHRITIWDMELDQPIATLTGHEGRIHEMQFAPTADFIASASADGSVRVWNYRTQQLLYRLQVHEGPVYDLDYSPEGDWLATASGDRTLRFWQLAPRLPAGSVAGNRVALSFDGTQLVTTDERGNLRRYDVAHDSLEFTLAADDAPILFVQYSPSGKYLLSGALDDTVKVWSAGEEIIPERSIGTSGQLRSALMTPDDQHLITGTEAGDIVWWDLTDGQALTQLNGHQGGVLALATDPGGTLLASSAKDGTIRIWEYGGTNRLTLPAGEDGWIDALAFSPDANLLLAASSEASSIHLWDVQSGDLLLSMQGHREGITSLAFSPDGQFILSASEDGTVKIWEVTSGVLVHDISGFADPIRRAFFNPAGDRVIVVEKRTGRLTTVELDANQILRQNATLYGPLTYAQLDRYALPDLFRISGRVQTALLDEANEATLEQWGEYYLEMAHRYQRSDEGKDYARRAEEIFDRLLTLAKLKPAAYYQRRRTVARQWIE